MYFGGITTYDPVYFRGITNYNLATSSNLYIWSIATYDTAYFWGISTYDCIILVPCIFLEYCNSWLCGMATHDPVYIWVITTHDPFISEVYQLKVRLCVFLGYRNLWSCILLQLMTTSLGHWNSSLCIFKFLFRMCATYGPVYVWSIATYDHFSPFCNFWIVHWISLPALVNANRNVV